MHSTEYNTILCQYAGVQHVYKPNCIQFLQNKKCGCQVKPTRMPIWYHILFVFDLWPAIMGLVTLTFWPWNWYVSCIKM